MKDFAKIFKRENGQQIVVMRDQSEEDSAPRVAVYFQAEGTVASFGACFTSELSANRFFKEITEEEARGMVNDGLESIKIMMANDAFGAFKWGPV